MRYRDLSYHAFTTDHRWLRLLHEYIQTYSMMAGTALPEHINAMRLVVGMAEAPEAELPNIILQKGLTIPEAVQCLLEALNCPILTVRKAVERDLLRLYAVLRNEISAPLEKRLSLAVIEESERRRLTRLLEQIHRLQENVSKQQSTS